MRRSTIVSYINTYIHTNKHTHKRNNIYYLMGSYKAGPNLKPAPFRPALIRPKSKKSPGQTLIKNHQETSKAGPY